MLAFAGNLCLFPAMPTLTLPNPTCRGAAGPGVPCPLDLEDEGPYLSFPDFSDRPEVEFRPPRDLLVDNLD